MANVTPPCILCGKVLKNVGDWGANQPAGATEFTTHGHYGSGAFDPMDGSMLVINICDDCLITSGASGRVLEAVPEYTQPVAPNYRPWGVIE